MIITDNDEIYPDKLRELKDHPKVLYALGNTELLNKTSIAIVGSRNFDNYGLEQTKRFSSYLAQKDICIVSGLARGIDTIAHTYSKDKIGKTIAVIASGFNHIYPPENKKLFNEIIDEGGLILSEWDENTKVDMHRFPKRNRIISGLSVGTLVIEATYKSGSTITGHYALSHNREVFCIPGDLDKIRSHGTNMLISEGANLVISPQDILDILEYDGFYEEQNIKIEPEYKDIYKEIGTIPISVNEITRRAHKDINIVNEALLMLELDGFIKSVSGEKYVLNQKVKE